MLTFGSSKKSSNTTMNLTASIITRCGRKYRRASAGGRTLNDLDEEVNALEEQQWDKDFFGREEEPTLRLRVLRARIAALPLPQPSRLLFAMDTLLASHYDEMGDRDIRRELEHLIHIALREKVKIRRAGASVQAQAVLTDTVYYCRLEWENVHHTVWDVITRELSCRTVLWFIVFILVIVVAIYI
ncbi:hypothetical protein CBW54_09405 [Yersinia kristensenii]|nr:hypothetical protein CBW54_09405 [Yersinia kristensenii]